MFLCICCAVEHEESEHSVEHPLPRAIGGHGWSISDVCVKCNRYCGKEIDYPFASHLPIRQLRYRFEIPGARGKAPSASRLFGETSGGMRVELELAREIHATLRNDLGSLSPTLDIYRNVPKCSGGLFDHDRRGALVLMMVAVKE